MKLRYITNSLWKRNKITRAMEAIDFALDYFSLEAGTLTVILSNSGDLQGSAARLKSNRYEIRVRYIPSDVEMLKAIFHEITHIKQYVHDGFRQLGASKYQWEERIIDSSDYWFSPWEMEARAMEEPLLYKFLEQE